MRGRAEAALTLRRLPRPRPRAFEDQDPGRALRSARCADRAATPTGRDRRDQLPGLRAAHPALTTRCPTGWPETATSWIGTNNMLERQNFGISRCSAFSDVPRFGADPIGLAQRQRRLDGAGQRGRDHRFLRRRPVRRRVDPGRAAGGDRLPEHRRRGFGIPARTTTTRIRDVVRFLLGISPVPGTVEEGRIMQHPSTCSCSRRSFLRRAVADADRLRARLAPFPRSLIQHAMAGTAAATGACCSSSCAAATTASTP